MSVVSAVPLPDNIIGPGIDALVALRPQTLPHCNDPNSVYRRVFEGWRAQAALVIRRFADEAASVRLGLATKDSLLELTADEYETTVDTAPKAALGALSLVRTGSMPGGMIRKGTRIRIDANDTTSPPVRSATYETTVDRVFALGANQLSIPVRARVAGTAGNTPLFEVGVLGVPALADTLFDPLITIGYLYAAGGSDGVDENAVRREAGAFELGQYAPTDDAIMAGALRGTGVRYVSVIDVTQYAATFDGSGNPKTYKNCAFTNVVLADASWSTSSQWVQAVKQTITDTFLGFGCAVVVSPVGNQRIRVETNVLLRNANSLSDTTEIDAAIQVAVADYFDNRPDWWIFKASQLRAYISRCDRRILTCTSAVVKNFVTNAVIADPSAPYALSNGMVLLHYFVPPNAITNTYAAPT